MPVLQSITGALREAGSTLLPVTCASCGSPDVAVCADCAHACTPNLQTLTRGSLTGFAGATYQGVPRTLMLAVKDHARTDAVPAIAPLLACAIGAALRALPAGERGVRLASIPPSRRSFRVRGYDPNALMLRAIGLRATRVLRHTFERFDQVGLGEKERSENLAGTMKAASRGVSGGVFLIVDDIVTTGATIHEAARAIESAGGRVVGFASLLDTPRRFR